MMLVINSKRFFEQIKKNNNKKKIIIKKKTVEGFCEEFMIVECINWETGSGILFNTKQLILRQCGAREIFTHLVVHEFKLHMKLKILVQK